MGFRPNGGIQTSVPNVLLQLETINIDIALKGGRVEHWSSVHHLCRSLQWLRLIISENVQLAVARSM